MPWWSVNFSFFGDEFPRITAIWKFSGPPCRIQILARAARRPDFQIERLVENLDQLEWLITRYLKRANVLLDVSRITSGKLALERLAVDVCEVAARGHGKFSSDDTTCWLRPHPRPSR